MLWILWLPAIVLAQDSFDPDTCPPQLDIALILDTSGSIDEVYEEQIKWVKVIVSGLPVHQDAVRVAAIQYAALPIVEFSLNSNDDRTEVIKKIDNMQFQSGVTKTGKALIAADHELFTTATGARLNASKIIILFTDGLSIDDPNKPSNRLRDVRGVNIYVISVGTDGFVPEMQKIAGDVENVYGPSDLYRFTEQLSMDVEASRRCPNRTTTSSTTTTIASTTVESTTPIIITPTTPIKKKKVRIIRRKLKKGAIIKEEIITRPDGKRVRRVIRKKKSTIVPTTKSTTRFSSLTKTTHLTLQSTTATPVYNGTEFSTTRKRFKVLGKKKPITIMTTSLITTMPTTSSTFFKKFSTTRRTTTRRTTPKWTTLSMTSHTTMTPTTSANGLFSSKRPRAFASKNQILPSKSDCPLDLLFVVDSSGSVGSVYEKQKDFLSAILENVNTEDQSHRVAFIQFAGARLQKMERQFASFSHNEEIMKAFNSLRTTYIGAALELAYSQLETRRFDVPTILIVLSDGFSHDDVREAAANIRKEKNVEIFVIVSRPTLLEIAGDESRLFINDEVDFLKMRLLSRLQCDL